MTVEELIYRLEQIEDKTQEIFVAHGDEDGEDILNIEENTIACFIIYKQ